MLSSKLIRMVSEHWEEIAVRALHRIQRDSKLLELGKLPESDLRERAQDILKNLGLWLVSREEELAVRYENLGRVRFQEGIPLHEIVYALQLIHECMIQYIHDQGISRTSLELYAEEELERDSDRVFDRIIYYFVRGYEKAMRTHAMTAG